MVEIFVYCIDHKEKCPLLLNKKSDEYQHEDNSFDK